MKGLTAIERRILIRSMPDKAPSFIEDDVPVGTEQALAARGLLRSWFDEDGGEWFETTARGQAAIVAEEDTRIDEVTVGPWEARENPLIGGWWVVRQGERPEIVMGQHPIADMIVRRADAKLIASALNAYQAERRPEMVSGAKTYVRRCSACSDVEGLASRQCFGGVLHRWEYEPHESEVK